MILLISNSICIFHFVMRIPTYRAPKDVEKVSLFIVVARYLYTYTHSGRCEDQPTSQNIQSNDIFTAPLLSRRSDSLLRYPKTSPNQPHSEPLHRKCSTLYPSDFQYIQFFLTTDTQAICKSLPLLQAS